VSQAPVDPETGASLSSDLAGSVLRHVSGYLAGMLVTAGAVSHDQQTQATAIIASVLLYVFVQAWSFVRKIKRPRFPF
jgi:hypothetical protein